MTTVEAIASVLGLMCVWLTIRQHIWCWPVGLAMVSLYVWIFYQSKLYSDMGLQVVYIVMQIYGWIHWRQGGPGESQLPVTRLRPKDTLTWLTTAGAGTVLLGGAMAQWTDASLPWWDAATTVLSLVAQWLLARKILESWLVWIVVDVLAIGIYLVKGLSITAGLYAVFLCLACRGWFVWRNSLHMERKDSVPASA